MQPEDGEGHQPEREDVVALRVGVFRFCGLLVRLVHRHDVDRNAFGLADHFLRDRAVPPLEPAAAAALADHDLARPQFARLIDQRLANIGRRDRHQRGAERRCEREIVRQLLALRAVDRARAATFDHHRDPGGVQHVGQPLGLANDLSSALAGAYRHHQPVAGNECARFAAEFELVA